MKKIFLFLSVIVLAAAGCNSGQAGLQEKIYDPAVNTNSSVVNAPVNTVQDMIVKVAVIALDDGGVLGEKIGCNDSVVYISKKVPQSSQPLNEAMKQLFNLGSETIHDSSYSKELYNVMHQMQNTAKSPLKFDRATLENGVAKIYLTGTLGGIGGVCDSPRVPAQIEKTAMQFTSVKSVKTFVNNKEIDWKQFLSQK